LELGNPQIETMIWKNQWKRVRERKESERKKRDKWRVREKVAYK